jgi:hypothetical protein
MNRITLALVLFATAASAGDLEVPLGGRAPIPTRKAIDQVVVRDPAMLSVVTTDGAVSLEGKQSGITGVTITYADNETETVLVVVGTATNSKGPRMERAQTIDLKAMKSATAEVKKAEPVDAKSKQKQSDSAAVREARDVVTAAAQAL